MRISFGAETPVLAFPQIKMGVKWNVPSCTGDTETYTQSHTQKSPCIWRGLFQECADVESLALTWEASAISSLHEVRIVPVKTK